MDKKVKLYFLFLGLYRKARDFLICVRDASIRENLRSKNFFASSTTQLIGLNEPDRLQFIGPVWVGSFTVIVIDDDPRNKNAQGHLELGSRVGIGDQCNIRATGAPVRIGNNVMIANGVTIISTNHGTNIDRPMMDQPWADSPSSIVIEDNCWIGAHVVLLPGAKVGTGSIVAAGAVVRGEIPPMSIYGGIPARHLKNRE